MSTMEQLEKVEHGTLGGFRDGCRGGAACPAVLSCRDVHTRWVGDYSFRRRVNAGVPVAVILADEAAAAARPVVKTAPKPPKRPTPGRGTTGLVSPLLAKVEAAHADGLVDRDIAERVGCGLSTVGRLRRKAGLAPNAAPKAIDVLAATHGTRLRELHAQGWNDGRISEELGVSGSIARRVRVHLGLPAFGGSSGHTLGARVEVGPARVRILELRAVGWSYHRIGEAVGCSFATVRTIAVGERARCAADISERILTVEPTKVGVAA